MAKEMFFDFWKHWDRVLQGSLPLSTGRISKLEHLLMSCHSWQGKDLQLPFKMPSQPPQIKLYWADMKRDVVFPQAPPALGSCVPGTRAGPKLHTRWVSRLLLV